MRVMIRALALACAVTVSAANLLSGMCVTAYNPSVDYFPNKITADEATTFNVTYHNSYKVVETTGQINQTFVLYQCGTPQPTVAGVSLYISVPVTHVALGVVTVIPWLETLGERSSIKKYTPFNKNFVHSPCARLLDTEEMAVPADGTDMNVTFVSSLTGSWHKQVAVTSYTESSVITEGEYIEFLSLFYNKEALGAQIYDDIRGNYECNTARAEAFQLNPKPKVVWAYYSSFFGGFDIGECPNYYCEFIESSGGEILTTEAPKTVVVDYLGTLYYYHDLDDFVDLVKDADILIYAASDWSATLSLNATFNAALSALPAVANDAVYAIDKISGNAWFEERTSEPHALLEDILSIVNPGALSVAHERIWIRNVVSENTTTDDVCEYINAPRQLRGEDCVNPNVATTAENDGDGLTGPRRAIIVVPVVAVAAICVSLLFYGKQYLAVQAATHTADAV